MESSVGEWQVLPNLPIWGEGGTISSQQQQQQQHYGFTVEVDELQQSSGCSLVNGSRSDVFTGPAHRHQQQQQQQQMIIDYVDPAAAHDQLLLMSSSDVDGGDHVNYAAAVAVNQFLDELLVMDHNNIYNHHQNQNHHQHHHHHHHHRDHHHHHHLDLDHLIMDEYHHQQASVVVGPSARSNLDHCLAISSATNANTNTNTNNYDREEKKSNNNISVIRINEDLGVISNPGPPPPSYHPRIFSSSGDLSTIETVNNNNNEDINNINSYNIIKNVSAVPKVTTRKEEEERKREEKIIIKPNNNINTRKKRKREQRRRRRQQQQEVVLDSINNNDQLVWFNLLRSSSSSSNQGDQVQGPQGQGGFRLICPDNATIISGSSTPPPNKNNNYNCTATTKSTNLKFSSNNISFQQQKDSSTVTTSSSSSVPFFFCDQLQLQLQEPDAEAIQQMKEMIYRAAAFRPVNLSGADEEAALMEKPKRKNVRISTDPQTVAARQRRERISERLRVLQKLVPGGTKMDTASMLDEAANYLKFLRSQVKALESMGSSSSSSTINKNYINTTTGVLNINNTTNYLHFSPGISMSMSSTLAPFSVTNTSNTGTRHANVNVVNHHVLPMQNPSCRPVH